jgi:hypothetical protein
MLRGTVLLGAPECVGDAGMNLLVPSGVISSSCNTQLGCLLLGNAGTACSAAARVVRKQPSRCWLSTAICVDVIKEGG